MAVQEQNKYIQFVNLLSYENLFKDISNAIISPLMNCLCIINKKNNAFLYMLPNNEIIEHFWECSSKVQRGLFSKDGKNILLILKVNSFQIYTIRDKEVSLIVQMKASALTNILKAHNFDYSAASQVDPLRFVNHELIILIDKKVVVNIEWSYIREPKVKYFVKLDYYQDLFTNDEYVFVLYNTGLINAYNIYTGEKYCNEFNVSSLISCNFFKVCVNMSSKLIATVNQNEEIILIDTNDLFDNKKIVSAASETKKEKWTWSYKNKKDKDTSKTNNCTITGIVFPPPGLVVSYLQFSLKGLFAFYCILGQTKCSSFKVIDELSAAPLYSFDGLVESKVLSGGPLPLVMSESILSMCLGVLRNDYFIIKLCEVVPNFSFSKEVERNLLSQPWTEVQDFHVIFLKIILNLHLNVFQSTLNSLVNMKKNLKINLTLDVNFSEKKIIEKVNELFKLVVEYKDNWNDMEHNCKQTMLVDCFLHAVRLLDITHFETKTLSETELFSNLLKQILLLFECLRVEDPSINDWMIWSSMTDAEVIQEAVVVGAISLAHVFLITNRSWAVDEIEAKFNLEAHAWIVQLITTNEIEKAKTALGNLGCDPIQYLRSLSLTTNDHILRDNLVKHLTDIGEFTDGEILVWKFNKQVENALSSGVKRFTTFEQKLKVSAKDRVNIVTHKLKSCNQLIDLTTLLSCPKNWRDMALTEVYFVTGDTALEECLQKTLCWRYLLESNQVDFLKKWIEISCEPGALDLLLKSSDYLLRLFYSLFAKWPITESMLNIVNEANCMTYTKSLVLDTCAYHGLFCSSEKTSLKHIVCRLENNSKLSSVRQCLSKETSNVSISDFDNMIFKKCVNHSLKPLILICLSDFTSLEKNSQEYQKVSSWLDLWDLFDCWKNNETNPIFLKNAIKQSLDIYGCELNDRPYLDAAIALIEKKQLSDVIECEGEKCTLLKLPLINIYWEKTKNASGKKPDVTIYDLLQSSGVPVDKLFLWQSQNKAKVSSPQDVFSEFPHFNHQVLGMKYGAKQNLNYVYYLKQGRPSFACNLFVVDSLRTQRRLTTKMVKRVCGVAHGLAIRFWEDKSIGGACIALIVMLGNIALANSLRIHLEAIECIRDNLPEYNKYQISTLVRGIARKELLYIQEMASLLELSITTSVANEDFVKQLQKWYLAVSFCNIHALPLPTLFLTHLANNHQWFHFIICLDIFKYPYEQAIELIEEIQDKILKSHLIRALTRTTLKLSTTSPSKSAPKILLEPGNNGKDDFDTGLSKENKDIFQTFVANVYTEVINTIQTFTDKNIVLPWSCEQDPDSDVLLTLLKCESEPDAAKSLLISAIELQSPVLAVFATCFQPDNVFSNLVAWLVSSIPTSMSRIKRKEEGQHVVDHLCGAKETESIFINFFSTGYFQTLFRGMSIFMPENPLTIFLNFVYQSVVLLDFETAPELLKEFTTEISHFRSKEPNEFFSKTWILNVVTQCIGNLLSRLDLQNSIKRKFLRILAKSELSSIDSNYLLWSQVCEILESTETNLDFIQLYDIATVSEELLNGLNSLAKSHQFTQVLEICSLLSINKDEYIIATWRHQLELSKKSLNTNVEKLWSESSLNFKDENVNPNMVALFYYEMASQFQTSSEYSLKNKFFALEYCLHWRRLMHDTLSKTFKEESDSIELDKWRCCIEPNFDKTFLCTFYPSDVSYSLLLNIPSTTKVTVRIQVLDTDEKKRVNDLINMFLDQNNFQCALRLGAFFVNDNQNLLLISSCLKMIHEEISLAELTKSNVVFNGLDKKPNNQYPCNTSESSIQLTKEQNQTLLVLKRLCEVVTSGNSFAKKILICYRLSVNLDSTFQDVASERDYLSLLSRIAALENINKLSVASDLIALTDLSSQDLSKFLKDKIVSAVMESYTADLVVSPTFLNVSLESDFRLIINLLDNPSLLGFELLQASETLPCGAAVEVLIKAHDCFMTTCNVEGIGKVLRRARIIASTALQEGQWQNLVRLLVGIGRYAEMSYVFLMLKDNGQFEQFLRKGMHKVPGLHVAISEFLQRYCPQDRELAKMVAAHFGLHSKLAEFWQSEAEDIISKQFTSDNTLKDCSKTRQALKLAMDNYSHAVHWFLQAGKINTALKVAHKAQMVALQISLLGGPVILKLQSFAEFQNLVNENLSVAQVMLICKAYDFEPDWSAALYERWIVKGDKTFYSDLKSSFILTPEFIQNHAHRYNPEQITNIKAKERMKQLIMSSSRTKSPLFMDLCKI